MLYFIIYKIFIQLGWHREFIKMKNRIDKELVNRKLVPSRTKAQELIDAGVVKCNGKIISKCNYIVLEDDELIILENDKLKYVSRGGLKLEKAINEFNVDFTNKKIMDIGSSTGGFCDCALQHGAISIIAIDVGTNLLDKSLRDNQKIELHEQTNFRELEHKYFENIDIITCDVSFISLKKIIEKIRNEKIKVDMICLIKPQFECGKEVARRYRGVILNKEIHIRILEDLINYFNESGFYVNGLTVSPIKGGDGNIEYLAYISNKIKINSEIKVSSVVNKAFKS